MIITVGSTSTSGTKKEEILEETPPKEKKEEVPSIETREVAASTGNGEPDVKKT